MVHNYSLHPRKRGGEGFNTALTETIWSGVKSQCIFESELSEFCIHIPGRYSTKSLYDEIFKKLQESQRENTNHTKTHYNKIAESHNKEKNLKSSQIGKFHCKQGEKYKNSDFSSEPKGTDNSGN